MNADFTTDTGARALVASRCSPGTMPKVSGIHQKRGIAYERRLHKELSVLADAGAMTLEYQPWFEYRDGVGRKRHIVPDFLLHRADQTLVIECKLTFVEDAITTLLGVYMPVLGAVFKTRLYPLVICRHLTPQAMATTLNLRTALKFAAGVPTLQWLGHGRIEW